VNLPVASHRISAALGADEPLVRFERVSKSYAARSGASVEALSDVDVAVPRGSILGVIGRSGAGKSTLIRLVNGLETPTAGRVLFDGVDVAHLDGPRLRRLRRSIGMIFQHFNLLSSRTAYDNVALPLEIAGLGTAEISRRVDPLLDLVGLGNKRSRYPAELSVGIARALATEPKALLSDEATSALDPETTRSILDLLARVNRELGVTILLITHEMSVIRKVATDVAVLDGGRIVEHGRMLDVVARPQHATTRSFFAGEPGRNLPAHLAARLVPHPVPSGQTLVRVTIFGRHGDLPILSQLARVLKVDINILNGTIDTVGGEPLGTIIVGLNGDQETVAEALAFMDRRGLRAEVLGHVA
jgi:D-methionine transport system ATP-binding protein